MIDACRLKEREHISYLIFSVSQNSSVKDWGKGEPSDFKHDVLHGTQWLLFSYFGEPVPMILVLVHSKY